MTVFLLVTMIKILKIFFKRSNLESEFKFKNFLCLLFLLNYSENLCSRKILEQLNFFVKHRSFVLVIKTVIYNDRLDISVRGQTDVVEASKETENSIEG